MNGWNSQHSEFTPAKGNPEKIKYLISEFKLQGIVSFDEVNKIITTTFIHNRFIRLSDLLTLNVSNVIAFTLSQFLQVIRQLFELLQGMQELQIQHGDLRLENILLDLTDSEQKLDKFPTEIKFQLKLIDFAQFYNSQQMEDDFERANKVYTQLASFFPQYRKQLELTTLIGIQKEEIFLQSISQLQAKFFKLNQQEDCKDYIWNSTFHDVFIQNYNKAQPLPHHYKSLYYWIQQNHQYHLIVNHYPKLISSSIFNRFKYSNEPKNFLQAYQLIDVDQKIFTEEFQKIKEQVGEESFQQAFQTYETYIESQLFIDFKQKGYLQNIEIFSQIIHNTQDIIQFRIDFFNRIIQHQKDEENSKIQLNEIIKTYKQSQGILNNMILEKINQFNSNNTSQLYNELANYSIQIRGILIEQLKQFIEMGYKYSKLLIDHCIHKHIGMQLKLKDMSFSQSFIENMVSGWLKWLDSYILNFNFNKIEQLNSINKELFIQFVQEKGFDQLKVQIKEFIKEEIKRLFENIHN